MDGRASALQAPQQQLPLGHRHTGLQLAVDIGFQLRHRVGLGLTQRRIRCCVNRYASGHIQRLIAVIDHGVFPLQISGTAAGKCQRFRPASHSVKRYLCNNGAAAGRLLNGIAFHHQLQCTFLCLAYRHGETRAGLYALIFQAALVVRHMKTRRVKIRAVYHKGHGDGLSGTVAGLVKCGDHLRAAAAIHRGRRDDQADRQHQHQQQGYPSFYRFFVSHDLLSLEYLPL